MIMKLIIGAVAGMGLAYSVMEENTDYVTVNENATIAVAFMAQMPMPLPVVGKINPESDETVSALKGVKEQDINKWKGRLLSKGKDLAKKYGSKKVVAAVEGFDRNRTDRRDIILIDPLSQDDDRVKIIGNGRSVEITLSNQAKKATFTLPDKYFLIEGIYDGDGQGIATALMIQNGEYLKPILLPVMKKGEKIRVEIL